MTIPLNIFRYTACAGRFFCDFSKSFRRAQRHVACSYKRPPGLAGALRDRLALSRSLDTLIAHGLG